jgi:tetratricopeptide (TPR) repeat protein
MAAPFSADIFQSMLAEAKRVHLAGDLARARQLYEAILEQDPDAPGALVMLADLDMRDGRMKTAKARLEHVVAQVPDSTEARAALAGVLESLGDVAATTAFYREETERQPEKHDNWVKFASALQTAGRLEEATAIYRRVLETWPDSVAGYFGLAAIDPALLTPEQGERLAAMAADERAGLDSRVHAYFALGNILERQKRFDEAFAAYAEGNRLRRDSVDPSLAAWMAALPGEAPAFTTVEQAERMHENFVRETIKTFTPPYFAKFGGGGDPSNAPIFIVGMPRSGSTLLEQILSSHPDVQGLGETLAVSRTFRAAVNELKSNPKRFNASTFYREVGGAYLHALSELGWDGRRRVIDKMLGNYIHVGIIRLALPNAVILHSVRDPVDTCLSNFRQLFGRRNEVSYDLGAIGRQYVRYREVMAHWDRVAPGHITHVEHERLIGDFEAVVREIVAACGLPWDDACLRFNENTRTVRTASVAQVRRPISTAAVERWRSYEAHLGPLFAALGSYAPAR